MAPRNIHRKPARGLPLLLVAALLISACGGSSGGDDDDRYRTFWAIDTTMDYQSNAAAWYSFTAEKRAETAHAVVYVDINQSEVTTEIAAQLGSEFDSTIHPNITTNFAQPLDVDGNGKTILLVYDIIDEYHYNPASGAYIGGYFFSVDMYSSVTVNNFNPVMKTNEGDILHIDCNPQSVPDEAKGTIAHEFQHLVNFSNVLRLNKTGVTDAWIDEGLSEASTHLCYGVEEYRIEHYNTASNRNEHPLFYWGLYDPSFDVLLSYAKSYLFFQYLRIQSQKGWGLYKDIIDSMHSDYRAVGDAMAGDAVLSSWGGFARLLLRWYAANNLNKTSGAYGYKNEITLVSDLYGGTSISGLEAGGGVIKEMNEVYGDGGSETRAPNFIYMSLTETNENDEDISYPFDDKTHFIAVYNYYESDPYFGILPGNGSSNLPASVYGAGIDGTNNVLLSKSPRLDLKQVKKPQMIDIIFPKGTAGILKSPMSSQHE